jgi:hypothetical protein
MSASRPVLLLFVLCFSTSALAQIPVSSSPPQITSDPRAVALIQQSLNALTRGSTVTDVAFAATAEWIAGSDNERGTATLKATALGDSRVDLTLPSGSRSEIRNHAGTPLPNSPSIQVPSTGTTQPVGFTLDPEGVVSAIPQNNMLTDPTWFFPIFTMQRLVGSTNYVLTYIGQDTIAGQPTLHVSASQNFATLANIPVQISTAMQRLSRIDLYFDPATSLPLVLAFNVHPKADFTIDTAIEIHFSDYRTVSGIEVAFRVQKYLNNGLILDLEVTDATLNSGLTGSTFQIE